MAPLPQRCHSRRQEIELRVLDLYAGRWERKLLEPGDMVVCADAKPSIQARRRIHEAAPPAPGGGQLVEHEYERLGAVTYLDAWDVRHGRIMGRTERKGGIAPFDRLVRQVMTKEPYRCARRVFWIVDNGSDHRSQASTDRLQGRWRNLILIHTPVHASWLNQTEIYHSILQRKVLGPNDFADTADLARTLNQFEQHYNQIAKRFAWTLQPPTRRRPARPPRPTPTRPSGRIRRLIWTWVGARTTMRARA